MTLWIALPISLVLFLAVYWLPGASLSTLFDWQGMRRGVRWLLPFPFSLVAGPALLGALAPLHIPLSPLLVIAVASGMGFLGGWFLRRNQQRPLLRFNNRARLPAPRWELPMAAVFLTAVAGIAFFPRLALLVNGSQIGSAGISDIYWHLSEFTALVRGGTPPPHFLFPDIPLDYYYWSWLLPAAAAELPLLGGSLMRLMNAHVLASLLVFLFLLFAFLRSNIASWKARWITLLFLTLAGGYDFFTQPSLFGHEGWQTGAAWLISQVQIPAFLVTYMWVPQHVAGLTSFLLTLFLWRNVRGSLKVRGMLAAVCAAYMFGASVFVFLAFGLAALLWAMLYRRLWMRRRAVPWLVTALALFLAIAGPQFLLSLGQESVVQWSGFRLNFFEALSTSSRNIAPLLDQCLTLLTFPLVASAVMCIEVGMPFIFYLLFAFGNAGGGRPIWRRFVAIFPALYLPIAFLLLPQNFGMRGILPALLVMNLGAALWLEAEGRKKWTAGKKAVAGYALAVLLAAQSVSPIVEWMPLAHRSLADVVRPSHSWIVLPITFPDGDYTLIPAFTGLPQGLEYIYWANANLPANALVVEEGPLPNDNRLHLLERMRLADPADVRNQGAGQRDFTLAGAADVVGWWNALPGATAVEKARASEYVRSRHVPIYAIVRADPPPVNGRLVYADAFVKIYEVPTVG
jgi:hypothetical protein